jgi:hypothetical protein
MPTPAPERIVVPNKPVDLFAPVDTLVRNAEPVGSPTTNALLHKFKGDHNPEAIEKPADPCDHPVIGGRVTICALLFGDYNAMHMSCISSILQTVPAERRQLRIATNAICRSSKDWLDGLKESGHIHTLHHHNRNIKKYPAMRQLFHEPGNPIEDKWLIWFDDDSIANVDQTWFSKMCLIIPRKHETHKCVGPVFHFTLSPSQRTWAGSRPWYRGRNWQAKGGKEAPGGTKINFASGGFWAMETAAMREANIPDETLGHNGGDYMVAAQLWQAGHSVTSWNSRKQFVNWSAFPRRGLREIHTGQVGWAPGGCPFK